MRAKQFIFDGTTGWKDDHGSPSLGDPQLVLLFGSREQFAKPEFHQGMRARFPEARILSVSAGDVIIGNRVLEGAGFATAVEFASTRVEAVAEYVGSAKDSESTGEALAKRLPHEGLRHVLLFSEGLNINGTGLIRGLTGVLPPSVSVTGGLASDGARFEKTLVGLDSPPSPNCIVAAGFYGESIRVGMGSLGGWESFGPEMEITLSEGNVLYELGGKPALGVYKKLLGARAYGLPASGLLFPLNIQPAGGGDSMVRTLLAVDEKKGSVSFAGDVPEGFTARVMEANLDRLIDAAGSAAAMASSLTAEKPDLALLISCIGRKLLLQLRTVEEVRSARRIFGDRAVFAGFYSYGEISPLLAEAACQLHNQTMTITTFSEQPA